MAQIIPLLLCQASALHNSLAKVPCRQEAGCYNLNWNMSLLFLISKTLLIVFFLVMFLRTNKPAWGIGLLTVTSAILLDTFLGTLGREEMLEELGYFFYIIAGALFAGATIWFLAIMKEFAIPPNKAKEVDDASKITDPEGHEFSDPSEDVIDNHRPIIDRLRFDSAMMTC